MRKLVTVVACAVVLGSGATAYAQDPPPPGQEPTSPSGTTFQNGNIRCGHNHTVIDGAVNVRNDWSGAEVCVDRGPVQGRVLVRSNYDDPNAGAIYLPKYVHVDGDKDNPIGPGHIAHINTPFCSTC